MASAFHMQSVTFASSQLDLLKLDWSKTTKRKQQQWWWFVFFWGASVCKYQPWEGLLGQGDSPSRYLGQAWPGMVQHGKDFNVQGGSAASTEWIQCRESVPSGPSGGEIAADLWWLHPTEASWLITTSAGPQGPIKCGSTQKVTKSVWPRFTRGLLSEQLIWCFIL